MTLSRLPLSRVSLGLLALIVACAFFAASWWKVTWSHPTSSFQPSAPTSSVATSASLATSKSENVQNHGVDQLSNGHHHGHAQESKSTSPQPLEALYGGACRGVRGLPLREGFTDDLPVEVLDLDGQPHPHTTYGSWEALGLEKSWMTFEQRYGPYGYGEDEETYPLTRANWTKVDWGRLQDECATAQSDIYYHGEFFQAPERYRLHLVDPHVKRPTRGGKTGRQAIVIRVWDSFQWTPEDLWNIRSIVNEAALATRGKYTVFLLVEVKRKDGKQIYEEEHFYRHVLGEAVPEEFRNMAVLYHDSLLKDWYPKINEHRPRWQIMQPLQLFAHFYPEFDHYWQFGMDVRFTGHVGKMLRAFDQFGKNEPYKQFRERASWTYIPEIHGSYEEFRANINDSVAGGATIWGPLPDLGGFEAIGPKLSSSTPEEDVKFEFGAGTNADVLILNPLLAGDRFASEHEWPLRDWFHGISENVPRMLSLPAQGRASRALLEAVHKAQRDHGIAVPGEATLPSFALWHGLQIVQVPIPQFVFPERDLRELNHFANGGRPGDFADGIADAVSKYTRPQSHWPSTFDPKSLVADTVFQRWRTGDPRSQGRVKFVDAEPASAMGGIPDGIPSFMKEVNGKVYAPAFILHPSETYDRNKFHYEI